MNRTGRVILISFIESVGSVCLQRAVFFFTRDQLGFSDAHNLWLALAFGATYTAGAVLSHRTSTAVGEKTILTATLWGQVIVHVLLAIWPVPGMLFVNMAALGMIHGLKWPVIESFVSAGRSPASTARALGYFNISWAAAIPLTMAGSGLIIQTQPIWLFVLPAVLHCVSLLLTRPLPARPVHLAHDHPDRPAGADMTRYQGLAVGSRWSLFCSYASLQVLAALLPGVFQRLGFPVWAAAVLAGMIEGVRCAAFVVLHFYRGWHGRGVVLAGAVIGLPVGFFAIVLGAGTAVVLAGEVVFGLAAGMIYYAHLYYSMVVKNASVDAGGVHETVIGLGFVIGPLAGLAATTLAATIASRAGGYACGIGPLFALCSAGALAPILKVLARRPEEQAIGNRQ